MKRYLPGSALRALYNTLVHHFYLYGIILWGPCNNFCSNKLRSLKRKALKPLGRIGWQSSSKHIFHKFKILKMDDL